jgi:hypothetical protein
MNIEEAKNLTPFEWALLKELRNIVKALEDLKADA